MAYSNDFQIWENGVPVIVASVDNEFAVWDNNVPIVDQDEGNVNAQPRRRTQII